MNAAIDRSSRSAVIVGCARDAAAFVPGVLSNIEQFASVFREVKFVFVENDSTDSTKELLQRWVREHQDARLLQLDGLAATQPSRPARIAHARNAYMEILDGVDYQGYDYLVVIDFDDVNAPAIGVRGFASAVRFLDENASVCGVFANSTPAYYDIWALRHPVWCPNDCWAEVRAEQTLSFKDARDRYVHSRQVEIPPDTQPIRVLSAFGGLGIYRLSIARGCRYTGLAENGTEVCEHVAFNRGMTNQGQLFIFPALLNTAPIEHLRAQEILGHVIELEQDGRRCRLVATPDHQLGVNRKKYPLYDRRLPKLAQMLAEAVPAGLMIDVGANIGDSIALWRLAGCQADVVALEPSEVFFALLQENQRLSPELFRGVRAVRAFVGEGDEALVLDEGRGSPSLHAPVTGADRG